MASIETSFEPAWVDTRLASELRELRARGEGQTLEFKREMPKQLDDLAKDIAAFATSGTGVLLIGVADDGTEFAWQEASTAEGRDLLVKRVQGICSQTIAPAITPTIAFAPTDSGGVMAIRVPKGTQPVYYVRGQPIVRHLSQARVAQPSEVIQLVSSWLQSNEGRRAQAIQTFLEQTIQVLVEARTVASEAADRDVDEWVDSTLVRLRLWGEQLRELSHQEAANLTDTRDSLLALSDALDACAQEGRGWDWARYLERANECSALMESFAERVAQEQALFHPDDLDIDRQVETVKTKLRDLVRRAPLLLEKSRLEDVQRDAANLGRDILKMTFHPLAGQTPANLKAARLGHILSLSEMDRLYADGGASYQRIGEKIQQVASEFIASGTVEFSRRR